MTIQMYADRKQLPLEKVVTEVTYEKVTKTDGQNNIKFDKFTRLIRIYGNLDATQRKRIIEIAEMCPVHKTLHQGTNVIETHESID
jgi:uncharacterized OsmC-like protein